MRLIGDALLPPETQAVSFLEEHLALILGAIAVAAAVTVALILILKKRKKK